MKFEDLKIGDCIHLDIYAQFIIKIKELGIGRYIGGDYIVHYQSFNKNGGWSSCQDDKIRMCTPQEVDWIEACEEARRFLPLKKVKTTNQYIIY